MSTRRAVTREELERPTIPYRDALAEILGAFTALPPREHALGDALGLVCAEPVIAPFDVPGFDNSAMDGYAVRAADTPGLLRLVGDLPAGTVATSPLEPGTASKIMTGAPVPPGADAVVPWEDTGLQGDRVEIPQPTTPGRHVRPRGEDVAAGTEIIAAGTVLRPVHLGVLASVGRTTVAAIPRPRVAILSTGDEVIEPGEDLPEGSIYDANRTLLRAMCERAGAEVTAEALLRDEPEAIRAWLKRAAAEADLVVATGGASVGEHDWMRTILEEEGALRLWRIAIKPGKPVAFARMDGAAVLGLPGNPGSAFVGSHVFVCPAIRKMAGRDPAPRSGRARLGAAVKGSPSRTLFCRVTLSGDVANPLPAQSSVVLSNLIGTEAFAIVPPGGLPEGAEVTVEMID